MYTKKQHVIASYEVLAYYQLALIRMTISLTMSVLLRKVQLVSDKRQELEGSFTLIL